MRKILITLFLVFTAFIAQFFWFSFAGGFWTPNLLLLVSIFFNLFWGIRYGLTAGFFAGMLMDSVSFNFFGTYLTIFLLAVFMTTFLKKYIYHMGSDFSRVILVFFVCLVYFLSFYCFMLWSRRAHVSGVFVSVFIPEVIWTVLISNYFFNILKRCALKLSAL